MLSTAKEHQIEVDIGNGENSAESQGEEADESELDELDLFPGGLELPPMRSPRGSLNSIYGSRHGSRHGSNISSRGSNSSTISWQSLQILRRIASSRAGSIQGKSPPSLQTHLYEHSMMYGDADPDSYRQSLVAGYLTQLPTIDNSAAEEIVHHHSTTTSNQILELPMLNATLSNSQTTTTLKPAGLVRSRDGSRLSPNTQACISLPSPNIQSSKADVLLEAPNSHKIEECEDDTTGTASGPDSTQLLRRGALVPPKIVDDPSEPVTDPGGAFVRCDSQELLLGAEENNDSAGASLSGFSGGSGSNRSTFPRRSSVVVIPPMQVCPGDLLVYSKALTHRGNIAELDSSTQSLANDVQEATTTTSTSASRKGKTPWSLLKLFERDKKSKGNETSHSIAHTIGLEEVLSSLSSSEFHDDQLIRLCGLTWSDFVELVDIERSGGSGLAWLSQSVHEHSAMVSNPTRHPSDFGMDKISENFKEKSQIATSSTNTVDVWSDEDEIGDNITSPVTSFKPIVTRTASTRPRLRRAQSERVPTSDLPNSTNQTNSPSRRRQTTCEIRQPVSSDKVSEYKESSSPPKTKLSRGRPVRGNLVHSSTFTAKDIDPNSRFLTGRDSFSRNEVKRIEAVWDLFQSETAFLLDHLMVLKHVYMEPLKKAQVEGFLMFAEPEVLFGNLDELCCVTHSFCKEFLQGLLTHLDQDGDLNVTELMRRLFEKGSKARMLSQAYHRYALNYINALNYLESLRRHNDFCDFEKWCQKEPRCKKLQLTDLLVSPVHHIMKIPLVIREIESRTDDLEEKAIITRIHEMKEHSLRELDDKMKWLKNFDRLLEIQRNIVWPSVLEMDPKQYYPEFLKVALSRQPCERLIVSPRRQILIEGPLLMFDSGKPIEMFVILFDDLLVVTRKKKALHKKKSSLGENWPSPGVRLHSHGSINSSDVSMKYVVYKQPLSLDRFFIHEVTQSEATQSKLDNAFVLICLNRFQQIISVLTFQADTEQLKNNWIMKLRDAQEMWKRTLQTTVFKENHQQSVNNNNSIESNECQFLSSTNGSSQSSPPKVNVPNVI